MWRRVLSLIIKELLATARDRQTRAVVLFAPPVLLLVYAFAITQEVSNADIAIYNRDTGIEARELLAGFVGAPSFSRITYLDSIEDVTSALDSKTVSMVVHIAPDFSRRVLAGDPAEVQILLDGRRSNAAQILLGYASRIVLAYNEARVGPRGPRPPAIVTTRLWFNPNADPLWYAVPALFSVMVAIVGYLVSALAIARERELGTFEQLLVSPLRPVEILIGKTLPALLIALASATAMLLLSKLVLNIPFEGSLVALYLSMLVYLAANIGIGLFISSLASTQQQAVIGLFIYMTPAVLLSGYATPVENMPLWLQWLTETNPITHFNILSKGLFLKDVGLEVFVRHLVPLALIAGFTLSAGAWLFRRKTV